MTLTLDEVRNIRFPMARAKQNEDGYRASAVDNFMDKLEVSYAQIVDENEALKKQAEGQSAPAAPVVDNEAIGQLTNERDHLAREKQQLEAQLNDLRGQLDQARQSHGQSAQLGQERDRLAQENQQLRASLDDNRQQLEQAHQQLAAQQQQLAAQAAEPPAQSTGQMPAVIPGMGVVDGGVERIVVTTTEEASPAVVRLVQLATQQAEDVLKDADERAKATSDDADSKAHEVTVDAQARAERMEADARANADRLIRDAQGRADNIENEAAQRREELFSGLEAERDQLAGRVDELRTFEDTYRNSLTSHLQQQIESLKNQSFSPGDNPTAYAEAHRAQAEGGDETSQTPRLDALMGEDQQQ